MRRAKTSVSDVSTVMTHQIRRDLAAAAGQNNVLSRAEQTKASPAIQDAADAIRRAGGPGTRVFTDAVERNLQDQALKLIGAVNQSSGSGAAHLSRTEAQAASRQGGRVGELVLRAYEVASGQGPDVDTVAKSRVTAGMDVDTVFKTFATEAEATAYQDPAGQHVVWLVAVEDTLLKKTFVSGRNDLWSQRFEVDRLTSVVTVLAEH